MTGDKQTQTDQKLLRQSVEITIRIGLISLLALWCFNIVAPFIAPVAWAVIIAVATYPLYTRLLQKMNGKTGPAAAVFTLVMLSLVIVPVVLMSTSTVGGVQELSVKLAEGTVKVPPPSAQVKEWPLVGEKTHALWSSTSENLEATLNKIEPELKALGKWLLERGVTMGMTMLMFVVSIIIAGVFLSNAGKGEGVALKIANRLVGDDGDKILGLVTATVRSVAMGVLGVAFIQALLAGIGLVAIGVPAAGVWALIVLLLAIMQLPPFLVLGPIIVYVFSVEATMPAVIFAIYAAIVSASDGLLKPLLLGRGVDVPMLVILLGAIGGMVMSGIIGLFVGSIVLALGYKLFMAWLDRGAKPAEAGKSPDEVSAQST